MVVIHVKRSETDQFLHNTSTSTSNDDLIRELVHIWNQRIILQRLSTACEELAKYGPAKPEELRGLDDDTPLLEGQEAAVSQSSSRPVNKDPSGFRTGHPPEERAAETLKQTAIDAKAYTSKDQVASKVGLTREGLQHKLENLRGAVMIAYPMGLPDYDPISQLLKYNENSQVELASLQQDLLDPETTTLWWAGKEFHRDQTVGDRVGRNEKTKVVARLQSKGAGAPVREPAVSEEERKAMMAFWFKKQEEAKQLAENDEDSYLRSPWADPKALKQSLLGTGNVSWRPGRQ